MKVLITGSSGYLGSILARSLVSDNVQVTGIDIRENPARMPEKSYSFYNCSITDKETLGKLFLKEEPTHVVHFACTFNKVRSRKKEHFIDVEGSKNVMEVSNMTKSVRQIIYSSSAAAYGGYHDNPEWIGEDYPLRPGKYRYGNNKKTIEEMLLSNNLRDDLRVVILRICTVTGPFYSNEREVQKILVKFPFLPEFTRYNKMQLLHEDDFTSLLMNVINEKAAEGVFNVAPDTWSYVNDLVPAKKYLRIPKSMIFGVLWILWNLRILNLQPSGLFNSYYPILLDPSRIRSRYRYSFRYTTAEAFAETLRKKS